MFLVPLSSLGHPRSFIHPFSLNRFTSLALNRIIMPISLPNASKRVLKICRHLSIPSKLAPIQNIISHLDKPSHHNTAAQ